MPNKRVIPIEFPRKFKYALETPVRYEIYHGGRGSGKSTSIATKLLLKSLESRKKILCGREFQNSIEESVHSLLESQIDKYQLREYFDVQKTKIIANPTGSSFHFVGIRRNINNVRSFDGCDIFWGEEAHSFSRNSLKVLVPTIRNPGSKLIFTFNPDEETDPVYHDFVVNKRPDAFVQEVNYVDNPWFPQVLKDEMEWCKQTDNDAYNHIWLGRLRKNSDAVVFNGKWEIGNFETPNNCKLFFGIDWGFSMDPTTIVCCFIKDDCLYISDSAGGLGIELGEETEKLFNTIPGSRIWQLKADSARPESISMMRRYGFNIVPVKKYSGSIEEGIKFMRSFKKIIINEKCKGVIDNFKLYKFKVDEKTNEIYPIMVDKWNDYIDAIRYALDDCINKLNPYQYHGISNAESRRGVNNSLF